MKYFNNSRLFIAAIWCLAGEAALAQLSAPDSNGAVITPSPAHLETPLGATDSGTKREETAPYPVRIIRAAAKQKTESSATTVNHNARALYEQRRPPSEGLAAVALGGRWGFVDRHGREVIAPQFEDVWGFREGLAAVKQGGRWGFVDSTGRVVIALQYDNALSFGEGRAAVQKNGRWGFVDVSGREVITPRYDKVWPFEKGRAVVVSNGHHRRIDRNGQDIDFALSRD